MRPAAFVAAPCGTGQGGVAFRVALLEAAERDDVLRRAARRSDKRCRPCRLVTHLDESFEDVERKLFGVDDVTEVMERRLALFHVLEAAVVLAQELACFVVMHDPQRNDPACDAIPVRGAGSPTRPPPPRVRGPAPRLLPFRRSRM